MSGKSVGGIHMRSRVSELEYFVPDSEIEAAKRRCLVRGRVDIEAATSYCVNCHFPVILFSDETGDVEFVKVSDYVCPDCRPARKRRK